MAILDSGNRQQYQSGAQRDIQEDKGRCDLLPLAQVAEVLDNDQVLESIANFMFEKDTQHLVKAIQQMVEGSKFTSIYDAMLSVSIHYKEGACKYGERNWEKGIPLHSYIDSAVRHYLKYKRGDTDENHDRAFIWNLLGAMYTFKYMPSLDDIPRFTIEPSNLGVDEIEYISR